MVVLKKEEMPVIAYTSHYKVKGKIFLPPGGRLSDFMSSIGQKRFIPVKDVTVTDLTGRDVYKSDFLVLNADEVIFVMPVQTVG